MKHLIIILFFLIFSCKSQRITTTNELDKVGNLATELCEKFDGNLENQIKLQTDLIQKEVLRDSFNQDVVRNLNTLNYRLTRNLWKNCSKYKLKSYALGSLHTRVLDIDNTLSIDEFEKLESKIEEIESLKNIQIIIVTIDDLFPYKNVTEYSIEQGNYWKIGKYPENGGVIIVLDKNDRKIRISTDNTLRQKLTDNECDLIVQNAMSYLKDNKYFNGLLEIVNEINKNI